MIGGITKSGRRKQEKEAAASYNGGDGGSGGNGGRGVEGGGDGESISLEIPCTGIPHKNVDFKKCRLF